MSKAKNSGGIFQKWITPNYFFGNLKLQDPKKYLAVSQNQFHLFTGFLKGHIFRKGIQFYRISSLYGYCGKSYVTVLQSKSMKYPQNFIYKQLLVQQRTLYGIKPIRLFVTSCRI